jgi:hypothetical protein
MGLPARWHLLLRSLVPILVLLGLGLRTYHYARNPSMWHDEAALVLNVLDKNLVELLGPLGYHEAAPPLFLWLERGAVLLFGDSTYALRLMPFLASCAALILLVDVARQTLAPAAVPWAVLLLACSDHLLWHACEAKPYSSDVLAAAVVLALYHRSVSWPLGPGLLLAAGMAPWVIFVSYPGCFLCGGLLVAFLLPACRSGRASVRMAYGLLAATILVSFALVVLGPAQAQHSPEMLSCWVHTWPRWDRPWTIPCWTLVQTMEVFRYAFEPAGQGLCLFALIGAISLWYHCARERLALLVTPVALALLAAYLHAYPYGGYRVVVFATVALAILSAEGVSVCLRWLNRTSRRTASRLEHAGVGRQRRLLALTGSAALVLFLLLPAARSLYRAWRPWPRPDSAQAAAFIWGHRQPEDPVAGNHWEYVYYFRGLEPPFRLLPEARQPLGTRLWLATTSGELADRLDLVLNFPGRWHVEERHDFAQSTVFLLSRTTDEAMSVRRGSILRGRCGSNLIGHPTEAAGPVASRAGGNAAQQASAGCTGERR